MKTEKKVMDIMKSIESFERRQEINIYDEHPMFSHGQTASWDKYKFYLDFTTVQNMLDGSKILNHRYIILDPFGIKSFSIMLQQQIMKFEKENGLIDLNHLPTVVDEHRPDYCG
jgi:hypothetical protein